MAQNTAPTSGLNASEPASARPAKRIAVESRAGAERDCRWNGEKAERVQRRVLRRVPHRARQVVDPQALEGPRGDGVDVQIAQLGERLSSAHEIGDGGEALRARGHDHERHTPPRR